MDSSFRRYLHPIGIGLFWEIIAGWQLQLVPRSASGEIYPRLARIWRSLLSMSNSRQTSTWRSGGFTESRPSLCHKYRQGVLMRLFFQREIVKGWLKCSKISRRCCCSLTYFFKIITPTRVNLVRRYSGVDLKHFLSTFKMTDQGSNPGDPKVFVE